jgi:hypothetical protein
VTVGKFTLADEPAVGHAVLATGADAGTTFESRARYHAGCVVRAMVRTRPTGLAGAYAVFSLAKKDATDPALRINLGAQPAYQALSCSITQSGKPLFDLPAMKEKLDWTPQAIDSLWLQPHAYKQFLPGWPEDFRMRVESDMAKLPTFREKWMRLRVELRAGSIRCWYDDRLLAVKEDAAITNEGTIKIELSPMADLASFSVEPLDDSTSQRGFEPIELGGYANGLALVDDKPVRADSLPPAGKTVLVEGVPFVFPGVNPDTAPAPDAKQIADMGDGSWKLTDKKDTGYETDNFGLIRYAGKFSSAIAHDEQQGRVLITKLEKQAKVHELMPWYVVVEPKKPITIAGAPEKIGLLVKGASDWGRMIYVLRDARGEKWTSIGAKDDYNCDDVHSWSSFNFDGWRYLAFEMPGHLGWDNYRRHGTTWWKAEEGDGIVDLPLKLEAVYVEQRSHVIYVNDVQPCASDTVSFGKMYVEYASPADATDEAVRQSRLRMPLPKGVPNLPNPIAEMTQNGTLPAPTTPVKLRPPEHGADGTVAHADFAPIEGAAAYHLWVSAHDDGRGATDMIAAGIKPGQLIWGLRPGIALYYWITYTDAKNQISKPSPMHKEVLVDLFKEK